MKKTSIGLITEAFGHGFMALNMAKSCFMTPVAFSEKETQEEFEAQVDQIYNNLVFFCPELQKASWDQRETLASVGWNIRQDLLEGKMVQANWDGFALSKLTPSLNEPLPVFAELRKYDHRTMFVPQKLMSDGKCGVNANEQSVSLDVFEFIKELQTKAVLGQHFHKVNDLETVKKIAEEFEAYIAGMTENPEVFGVRGVSHKMYWDLYRQLNCCVGIAGTHTWYLLTCFPEIPQIILYNKKTVENWEGIEQAYQKAGYKILCLGYDEATDMHNLAITLEQEFLKL